MSYERYPRAIACLRSMIIALREVVVKLNNIDLDHSIVYYPGTLKADSGCSKARAVVTRLRAEGFGHEFEGKVILRRTVYEIALKLDNAIQ